MGISFVLIKVRYKKYEREIKNVSCGGERTSICHIVAQNFDRLLGMLN